jgi:hypothetical protein
VGGYDDLDLLVRQLSLESDMAAPLADNGKSEALEGRNNAIIILRRTLRVKAGDPLLKSAILLV